MEVVPSFVYLAAGFFAFMTIFRKVVFGSPENEPIWFKRFLPAIPLVVLGFLGYFVFAWHPAVNVFAGMLAGSLSGQIYETLKRTVMNRG